MSTEEEKPHYIGHRQRLRARLFEAGPDALQDYELLELILGAAIPRRDVKPLAKQLLSKHSAWEILQANVTTLQNAGVPDSAVGVLQAMGALALRAQKKSMLGQTVLSGWQRLLDYCHAALAHEKKEQVRLLFLNRRNELVREDIHQRGTIDHTPLYPREVVQRALEVGAGALVLVHNHPSGDPTPSPDDITMTQELVEALKPLNITLHDHLVVGRQGITSFKQMGLLG